MINDIMTADITHMNFSTKNISFTRMQSGWLFPADRTEKVSRFVADFYDVHGLQFVTKKRREHLTEEDIVRNKKALSGKKRSHSTEYSTGHINQSASVSFESKNTGNLAEQILIREA